MVGRIVGGRIYRETARWTMLKALVHGQDDHPSRACQPAVIEYPGEIGQDAWIFAPVTIKNFTNLVSHGGSFYRRFWEGLLFLRSFLSAELLCMAKWSVLSLLIKYCGSSFEARTV